MKQLLVVATASLALAACGSKEEPAPVETGVVAEPTMDATATGNVAGDYEIKMADGTVTRQRINADGTYVDSDLNGTETERGTWRQQGSQMCFDPDGAAPETCYAGGAPSADGSFEMRDAEGNVTSSVRKVEVQTGMDTVPAE